MIVLKTFQESLSYFLEKFDELAKKYDHTINHCSELELLIDDYSKFITNEKNQEAWEQLELHESSEWSQLVANLRKKSALCVAIMEKYRALKLRDGHVEIADYFKNIESCIEEEFGSFRITSESKVLLVGSGSFPMTPLLIAKRTGAEVVGIDIDDEAIQLGRNVVERLGSGLNIRLEKLSVEDLDFTKDVTHVIFSSTVESKYDILDQLYELTNDHVVVAMRYGNQLKSLFNYPLREVDEEKWKLVEHIIRPQHVFDIALYKKV
ncbi:nicotianamine synthase family protein [Anoxybacteroides rupiense]|uniref:nicotianamine synthase family protein n=1 Tax=Anoxybacteroides rupiense TaxID=311460 RepID=UPI001605EB80|nr:nicotianamine synthase family protein [Anoxybacillus rupiensis]MBB3908978.1 2-polyprenyl-3-methyl-5-hydroxy-6-metoxy-1,4-benzoquinol methylase [Anoxybacillus rupiensis]